MENLGSAQESDRNGQSRMKSAFAWVSDWLLGRKHLMTLPLHYRSYRWFQRAKSYDQESHNKDDASSTIKVLDEESIKASTPSHTQVENPKQTRPGLSEEVVGLVAVTSGEYERYQRNVKVDKHIWESYMIDPLEFDFSEPELSNEWKSYIHPEGATYFYNASQEFPVVTDVFIHDKFSKERLESYIGGIFTYIQKYNISMPADICLVLEFRQSGRCGYYFVNHKTQSIFWLDEFDAIVFLGIVRVNYTASLIGHDIKALYWLHQVYFPHLRPVPEECLLDLKDSLYHAIGDSLTSPSSTTPYDLDTLQKMLRLVKDIIADRSLGKPGSATVIYRFLYIFEHERFLHLHGEQAARLDADQSIHPERNRTFLMKILSPVLLYGPDIHLRQLEAASVDSLVAIRRWTALLEQLTNEWKEFTLYATVLLNANVAFLAIQSVDASAPLHGHSPMQKASYFSMLNNIGAILLGLLLNWQHEARTPSDSRFLANRSYSGIGLETLALLYSLPYALLMWGFLSFLVAFLLMCLHSPDKSTIAMLILGVFSLLLLLFWTASLSFDGQPSKYGWLLGHFTKEKVIEAGKGRLRKSG